MKKFYAWVNRNFTSICTGWVVALIMAAIIIAKDMKHTSKEIDHMINKIELINHGFQLFGNNFVLKEANNFG